MCESERDNEIMDCRKSSSITDREDMREGEARERKREGDREWERFMKVIIFKQRESERMFENVRV